MPSPYSPCCARCRPSSISRNASWTNLAHHLKVTLHPVVSYGAGIKDNSTYLAIGLPGYIIPAILMHATFSHRPRTLSRETHHSVNTLSPGVVLEIAVIHPMGIRKAAAIATAKKRNQTGVCRSVVITRMAASSN